MIKLVRFDYQIAPTDRAFAFIDDRSGCFLSFDGATYFTSIADLERDVDAAVAAAERDEHMTPRAQVAALRDLGRECVTLARREYERPPANVQAVELVDRLRKYYGSHPAMALALEAAAAIEDLAGLTIAGVHPTFDAIGKWSAGVRAQLEHGFTMRQLSDLLRQALDDLDSWGKVVALCHDVVERSGRTLCTWCGVASPTRDLEQMRRHALRCQSSPVVRLLEVARRHLELVVEARGSQYIADEGLSDAIDDASHALADIRAELPSDPAQLQDNATICETNPRPLTFEVTALPPSAVAVSPPGVYRLLLATGGEINVRTHSRIIDDSVLCFACTGCGKVTTMPARPPVGGRPAGSPPCAGCNTITVFAGVEES